MEVIGHIQSAGCLGQKEEVTAAHNACIRELHGKADRHMKLLTLEMESSLGTLWDQEQCTPRQFCSKDELWEAAKEEEMKIPWKEVHEELPVSEDQYQERFWRRRLDEIGLDTVNRELLAIEFKRTQDTRSNYVEPMQALRGRLHLRAQPTEEQVQGLQATQGLPAPARSCDRMLSVHAQAARTTLRNREGERLHFQRLQALRVGLVGASVGASVGGTEPNMKEVCMSHDKALLNFKI
jgi:hypothetical protein